MLNKILKKREDVGGILILNHANNKTIIWESCERGDFAKTFIIQMLFNICMQKNKDENDFEQINRKLIKDDLENLPIPDNSNEIDINGLKQIISSRDEYRKAKDMGRTITRKRVEEEPREEKRRVYDINVLLETAKNEVNKNNEVEGKKLINANFLTDLDDAKIPNNDIVEVSEVSQNKEKETSNTDSLPLDILVDLKGTDNTVVTDPIVKDEVTMIEKIKDGETFYSGSFNFTKKDFAEEDDDFFEEKSHTGVKVFFLIIGLLLLAGVIYLAITKYVL